MCMFMSVNMADPSILLFYFRSHTFMVCLRTTKVHSNQRFQGTYSTLSTPEIPPVKSPPCLRISNRKYPPCPQNSIIVNPPLSFGNPKSRPSYGMDIFWNRPILLEFVLVIFVYKSIPYFIFIAIAFTTATNR